MDEETKKLIVENYALNKDNNEMLHKLMVFQKWNNIAKIISWSFIILTSIGAMYFIQQNLGSLIGAYTGGAGVSDIGNITKTLGDSSSNMTDLLKSLNN